MERNNGYTGIDLVIAIIVILISIGIMTTFVSGIIANIQSIKYGAIGASCMIEIAESIDACDYNSVNSSLQNTLKTQLKIPNIIQMDIDVEEPCVGYIKKVTINLSYEIDGTIENLNVKRLKVVEL